MTLSLKTPPTTSTAGLWLHCVTNSVSGCPDPGDHCEAELHKGQLEAIDSQSMVEEAVGFLNEALVRLDAAMEHQAAALVDHAINVLAGWTGDATATDMTSTEPH